MAWTISWIPSSMLLLSSILSPTLSPMLPLSLPPMFMAVLLEEGSHWEDPCHRSCRRSRPRTCRLFCHLSCHWSCPVTIASRRQNHQSRLLGGRGGSAAQGLWCYWGVFQSVGQCFWPAGTSSDCDLSHKASQADWVHIWTTSKPSPCWVSSRSSIHWLLAAGCWLLQSGVMFFYQ